MTIELAQLVQELQVHAPMGVEVPRDPDTNEVRELTIQRWAQEAARQINHRRGRTTVLETTITCVEDQQEYDLPAACRKVVRIERVAAQPRSTVEILGVPQQGPFLGFGEVGHIPSGQEISGAIDMIDRMRLQRVRREDQFSIFGGQLRLLFPIVDGEVIKVTYRAVDRTLAALPDDRFDLVMIYLQVRNLDWFIGKHAHLSVSDDTFGDEGMAALYRRRGELQEMWTSALNGIGPEAN